MTTTLKHEGGFTEFGSTNDCQYLFKNIKQKQKIMFVYCCQHSPDRGIYFIKLLQRLKLMVDACLQIMRVYIMNIDLPLSLQL